MANQVATINFIPIGDISEINGISSDKIAEFNTIPFVIELPGGRILIVGGSATKAQISINDGTSWADISTGTLSTARTASQGTNIYVDAFTGAPPNTRQQFLVVGYSGSTSHVSRSFDGGVNWDVSMHSGRIYDWTSICRDASYVYVGEWSYNYYLRSTDWGKTFTQHSMPTGFGINFVQSYDGQYVYAGNATGQPSIQKSSNYGVTFGLAGTTQTTGHKFVSCDGSGQHVFAYYLGGAHSIWFSSNYGTSFTRLNAGANGGQASHFRDGTLHFYTVATLADASYGFLYSTDASTWTRVQFPSNWTTGWTSSPYTYMSVSQAYKRIYIFRPGVKDFYKLNDAKNGWDLVYTMDNGIPVVGAASEFRDEVFVGDSSQNFYLITPSGTRTGPIYTGATTRNIPSLF